MKYRLLDLFCGAGGAAMGYHRAGFEVVGVDKYSMPHYPFEFHQADALEYLAVHGNEYDVIHASPPCPRFSELTRLRGKPENHPDLIDKTRQLLKLVGKPYVIENVPKAPLRIDIQLCGTMFDIRFPRHRIFESSIPISKPLKFCDHRDLYDPYHGGEMARNEREKASKVMGIDWFMTRPEVRNAIPPAYTEFIGCQLMAYLELKS